MLGRIHIFLLILTVWTQAYTDYDVDGVDDSIDQCLNTPFDVLVDAQGCDSEKQAHGLWTFALGTLYTEDREGESISNVLFALDYQYKAWDFSLSSFKEINSAFPDRPNALYTTLGYTKVFTDKSTATFSIGTKQLTMQDDYYIGIDSTYSVSEKQNLHLYYNYTIAQDSTMQKFDNFHTVSLGTGRYMSERWYATLSYDYASSPYGDSTTYQALTLDNTWMITSKIYVVGTYSYGLNDDTNQHTISLQLGFSLE